MNQKVQDFIEKAKTLEKEHDAKERAEVLISAGLYDEERVYSNRWTDDCPKWDVEKQQYYGISRTPLEISNEEYAEVLKYSELIKGLDDLNNDSTLDNVGAENALNTVAILELVCGIIISLILLCAGFAVEGYLLYGVCIGGIVLIMSIVNWSIMKVWANISMSLKEINQKVK